MSPSSTVELDEAGHLVVRLRGEVGTEDIERLSNDLLPRIDALDTGGALIIDMIETASLPLDARMRLMELQRGIAPRQVRTAFVADRPRFRGIGLFVAHVSEDPNARCFNRLDEAKAWLSSGEGRLERLIALRDRLLSGDRKPKTPKPKTPKRRSSDELKARVLKLRESDDDQEGGGR